MKKIVTMTLLFSSKIKCPALFLHDVMLIKMYSYTVLYNVLLLIEGVEGLGLEIEGLELGVKLTRISQV